MDTEPKKEPEVAAVPQPILSPFQKGDLKPPVAEVRKELAEKKSVPHDLLEAIIKRTDSKAAIVITFDEE